MRAVIALTVVIATGRAAAQDAGTLTCADIRSRIPDEPVPPADEATSPPGTPFDRLTPHDHLLAAQTALDARRCRGEDDCRDRPLAERHILSFRGHRAFFRAHCDEIVAVTNELDSWHAVDREEAARIARRGARPTQPIVRAYLQRHVGDPRGLQLMSCGEPDELDDSWRVACEFRARNGFGALVMNRWYFVVQGGHVIDTSDADE